MNFKILFGREIVIANSTFHNMELCFFIILFFVYVMLQIRRYPQAGEILQLIFHNASSHKCYTTVISTYSKTVTNLTVRSSRDGM